MNSLARPDSTLIFLSGCKPELGGTIVLPGPAENVSRIKTRLAQILLLVKTMYDESRWAESLNLVNYRHLVTKLPVNRSLLVVVKATIR